MPKSYKESRNSAKSSKSNRYGIDNLTYNLIATLHEKARVMEFEQYCRTLRATMKLAKCFEELQRQDRENIRKLQNLLQIRIGGQDQGQRAA